MSIFILLLSLSILIILYFQPQKNKHANKLHHLPGPPALPFIGNLHQFDGKFPHTYLYRLSRKYGPILSLKLGIRRVVVISSAEFVQEIIKSHDVVFSSRPLLVALQKLSYNGVDVGFSPYNDMWREMKKISTIHLFSTKRIDSFRPIFKDELTKMIKKITKDATSSTITDLSETMLLFANNTICRVAVGRSYGDEGYIGKNRFFDLLHDAQAVLGGFFVQDYLPQFRWIDELSGLAPKLENIFMEFDCLYDELIDEHMNPNRPKSMEGDIIDIMLKIKRDGISPFDLTSDHIKALVMNIVIGGSDTVVGVLAWVMTALMKNPSSMKKVQAEIRQLAGKKDLLDEEDIVKLPYLIAVINETCRLYPPIPLIPRETMQKCSINGYEIEAGTTVYINAYAIARDPVSWENPNEFVPERFLATGLDVRGQNPEVIPFGFGRRRCPGYGIGMSGIELAMANLLYKFEWGLPNGMTEEDIDFEVVPGMTMHKSNDLRLVAKLAHV